MKTGRVAFRFFLQQVGLGLAGGVLVLFLVVYFSPKPELLSGTPFGAAYYDRTGKLLRISLASDQSYRLYTPLEDMSDDFVQATLFQEDRHFFSHPGVNPFSLLRGAYETYIRRSRAVGGSTLTMQLVRLRDGLNTRTLSGKIAQIVLALELERHYSKREILEAYLNLAPYGGNIYGAGTASLIYFRQPVKNLALPQSVALAVIPQNPVKRFPLQRDTKEWTAARARLFARLPERGDEEFDSLLQMELPTYSRADLPFDAPHFVDGLTRNNQEGSVSTTLDLKVQKIFERRMSSYLTRGRGLGLDNATAMLVHFPTMEVRALVGSGGFLNSAIDGQVDGTLARRSPGSTLKPFVYALALEKGLIHPESLLEDERSFFAEYRPGNFDKRFLGAIPAREALVLSRNIPAINLANQLNDPDIYDFLQTAGAGFPKDKDYYGLAIVVGSAEITLQELVRLYAMLANGGKLRPLKMEPDQKPTREDLSLLSPEAALLTLSMLERPQPDTLPFSTRRGRLPVYWKTGTSNGFRDAWCVGVFGPYVLAVWVGHFDGHSNPALVGSRAATPLFFELADSLQRREHMEDFVGPAMDDLNIARVSICMETGQLGSCEISKEGLFIPGKSPFSVKSTNRKGPEILSPRPNISYAFRYGSEQELRIPLEAKSDDEQNPLHWFANNRYLGTSNGTEPLFWAPQPGEYSIRLVDGQGRADWEKISIVVSE